MPTIFHDIAFLFKKPLRAKIVTYFVRQSGGWASASDVAAVIGSTRAMVAKELPLLASFGLLISKRTKRTAVYRVNEQDELYAPLLRFLTAAATPTDREIVESFRGIRGIRSIIAAGLLADEPKSSVELLIVCRNPNDTKIAKAMKRLESLAAVPLRYAVLEEDEYHNRRQAFDRMLRDLFEFHHRIILEKEPS
ncbi:MAG: hypothetical protein ACE5F4_02540 [Candidatus Paceibacteria bacterium]